MLPQTRHDAGAAALRRGAGPLPRTLELATESGRSPSRKREGLRLARPPGVRAVDQDRDRCSRARVMPDVQQAAFLVHRFGGVGEGDRHQPFAEPHEEHGVPFQALGGVQRRQRDALDGGGVLGEGPFLEFVDEVRRG